MKESLQERIKKALEKRNTRSLVANQELIKKPVKSVTIRPAVKKTITTSSFKIPEVSPGILLTGGIGDVIALESFFSQKQKDSLKFFTYATQKSNILKTMLSEVYDVKHIEVWDDFNDFWAFHTKEECLFKLKDQGRKIPGQFSKSEDWSIYRIFPLINDRKIVFQGSSFLKKEFDINNDIPKKYVVICPFSSDKRLKRRDFDKRDWNALIRFLAKEDLKGVVLDNGDDPIPDSKHLVDLRKKTGMLESIEIIKKSNGYIGIDSCLSVIAAQVNFDFLTVKSVNKHCYNHKHIYYCLKNKFDFMGSSIEGVMNAKSHINR